jgi:hypothetical protein
MKKIFTLFFTGALMSALCVGFVACNDEQNNPNNPNNEEFPENGIKPTLPLSAGEVGSESDKEVTTFFDENLRPIAIAVFDYQDGFSYEERCVLINSVEELPVIISDDGSSIQYPPIDFKNSTLVVGQWTGGGSSYLVLQNLMVENDVKIMTLTIGQKEGLFDDVILPIPFWGIYPKIDAESINISTINLNK